MPIKFTVQPSIRERSAAHSTTDTNYRGHIPNGRESFQQKLLASEEEAATLRRTLQSSQEEAWALRMVGVSNVHAELHTGNAVFAVWVGRSAVVTCAGSTLGRRQECAQSARWALGTRSITVMSTMIIGRGSERSFLTATCSRASVFGAASVEAVVQSAGSASGSRAGLTGRTMSSSPSASQSSTSLPVPHARKGARDVGRPRTHARTHICCEDAMASCVGWRRRSGRRGEVERRMFLRRPSGHRHDAG